MQTWKSDKIGNYIKLQGGNAFRSSNYVEKGIPLVRIGNVGKGFFVGKEFVYISKDEYDSFPAFHLKENDILVGMTGELGKVAKIHSQFIPAALNQRVGKVIFLNNSLDKDYLYQLLLSDYFIQKLEPFFAGAAQKNISSSQLESVEVFIPPNSTQIKISKILTDIDELISKTDQVIQKSEVLKQGLLVDLISNHISQNSSEKWEIKQLKEVCDLITDGKHGDCENQENSGYYFISSKDIHDGVIDYTNSRQITKIDFEDANKRTRLGVGDLVMTNSGTIGRMAIAQDDHRTYTTTFQKSVAIIKPKKTIVSSEYLQYYFLSVLRSLQTTSNGSAQMNLLLKDMRSLQIPVPDKKMQNEIVSVLFGVDQKISIENEIKNQAVLLKNGLMKDIFSQKVEIN